MSAETRPQRRFADGKPVDENQETAVPALLAQAVEDLAVYEPVQAAIAELESTEDAQVVEAYLLAWKQALRHHLESTAVSAVDNFQAGFQHFQAGLESEGPIVSGPASDNAQSDSPTSP